MVKGFGISIMEGGFSAMTGLVLTYSLLRGGCLSFVPAEYSLGIEDLSSVLLSCRREVSFESLCIAG